MSVDPEAPDTPIEEPAGSAAPEAPPQPPQHDWEQRYKETHSWGQQAHDVLKDPNKLIEYIEQNHRDLLEDDDPVAPEPVAEPEVVRDPRVDELAEWKQTQEARQAEQQFQSDLAAEVAGRDLPDIGRQWVEQQTLASGADRDALGEAVKKWFEFADEYREPPKPKPKAAHVPTGGSAPKDTPPEELTSQERVEWMAARLAAEAG